MELKIDKQFINEAVQKAVQKAVEELKQNNIWIPEGMTNGEVIQALFPNCVKSIDDEGWFITNVDGWTAFTPKWWNAPYQKGGEEV